MVLEVAVDGGKSKRTRCRWGAGSNDPKMNFAR